jgi:hypothetical protein
MSINIFNLSCCQPLVWVVLALVVLLALPNVFLYNELSCESVCKEQKSLKIFNWVVSVAIVALWVTIIAFNHTTVWQDIVNFAFVIGFSFVFAVIGIVAFTLIVSVIIFLVYLLYVIFVTIKELFGKGSDYESDYESDFYEDFE